MRLTLRLLLAYLDKALEPADAKAVEAKIAESESVASLVNHIRDITKRVRIPAPEVMGKGLGLDPNTVAEYLDNTLSDDAVRDFENVCMSSDVHMAEVAACHEILYWVLVKPAEIDPAIRQRMYGLPTAPQPVHRAEAVPVAPVATAQPLAAAAPTLAPAEPRRKVEIPDYLRQEDEPVPAGGSGRFMLAAVLLLALLLGGGAAALALVPNEQLPAFLRPVAANLFANKPKTAKADDADDTEEPATNDASPSDTLPDNTSPGVADGGATATADIDTSTTGLQQPPSALSPSARGTGTSPTGITPLPPVPSDAGSTPLVAVAAGTAVGTVVAPLPPVAAAMPAPAASAPVVASAPPAVATTSLPAALPVAQPPKIEPVGRVSSAVNQVLLRFDPQQGWSRLQARDTVSVGDRLLALPGYRPQVALTNSVTIEMLGGTEIELLPVDAAATPGVRLMRGRVLLFTIGGPQAKVTLNVGTQQAVLTLSAAELALEHAFQRAPGVDPGAAPLPWTLTFHAKSGDIAWTAAGAAPVALAAPSQWVLAERTPLTSIPPGTSPAWITGDDREPLEKQAADFIERSLASGKAVTVALEEAATDRRIENVQLALRCLAQLGDYNDIVPYLSDPNQRQATWEKYLDLLATSMDYGPYFAERVRDAFILKHGAERGSEIYRLMWGYGDEQLKGGDDQYLINSLEHEQLDFRVVAFWNLMRITGQTLGYVPQDPPLKRKVAVQKWQKLRDDGKLVRKPS